MPEGTETPTTQAPATGANGGEQPGTKPVTLTPSPEGGVAAAGEQLETSGAEFIAIEQLSPEALEQLKQQVKQESWPEHQSRADKQVTQRLRQAEELRAQQAEAKRLQALPGDQFKQAMLQRQALQQTQQVAVQQASQRISAMYGEVTGDVLNVCSDPAKRAELSARNDATFGGFVKAVMLAEVEIEVAKRMAKVQKTERTAAQKEARAAVGGMPQLGSGGPSSNIANLTPGEKIRVGLEQAQREQH